MGLSSENQRSLSTAKNKLRQAKNNFLKLRKTSDDAFVHLAKKSKRAVRRDILSIDDKLIRKIKNLN